MRTHDQVTSGNGPTPLQISSDLPWSAQLSLPRIRDSWDFQCSLHWTDCMISQRNDANLSFWEIPKGSQGAPSCTRLCCLRSTSRHRFLQLFAEEGSSDGMTPDPLVVWRDKLHEISFRSGNNLARFRSSLCSTGILHVQKRFWSRNRDCRRSLAALLLSGIHP